MFVRIRRVAGQSKADVLMCRLFPRVLPSNQHAYIWSSVGSGHCRGTTAGMFVFAVGCLLLCLGIATSDWVPDAVPNLVVSLLGISIWVPLLSG